MKSQTSVLLDVPPPRLLKPPPGAVTSAAVEAIEFAEEVCGIFLDPWQRWFVEMALSERADGTWAAFEVGLVCPRQNGKNFILEVVQIACIYLFGDQTLVHSAHKFDTSVEHFQRLKWLFENTPELSELLLPSDRSFVTANGKEHIRFNTGQRILFKARYRGAGRGFTGDKVFLDEAYELPAKAIGALIPTLSTRPMAQVWYTSSAPHETSSVLHAVRNRGISNDPDDRLVWVEYGNDEDAGDDMEAIRRANPAIASGRITEEYIRQEILTFSGDPDLIEEHRRERMGIATMPIDLESSRPVSAEQWSSLLDATSTIASHKCWALAVSPDRGWASLGVAGRRADGKLHVAWLERRKGTAWIVPTVKALYAESPLPLRIHKSGPENSFTLPLTECGVKVVEVSSAEVTAATGQFIDACNASTLRHLGQASLEVGLKGAMLRTSSDGAALWSQRNSQVEISALMACTVALGGVPAETSRVFAY
jgi:hypothetical protein